jgi:acyl dehydratase
MVDGFLRDSSSMGSPGMDEIRWLQPVRGGDTLSVTATVLESRPSTSKPDRGVVIIAWQARNQREEVVATIKAMGMFIRRPKSS